MRRRLVSVLTVLLLSVALVAAVPAVAAEAPVGDQINVFTGHPDTFPADTPFHIVHGWFFAPDETTAVGAFGFRLDVAGEDQGRGSLLNHMDGDVLVRQWLYNFHDGMPVGTYTFTGHWIMPCSEAVDGGFVPGPCLTPNAPVEGYSTSLTVTFID